MDKHIVIIQFAQQIMQSQQLPHLCSNWVAVSSLCINLYHNLAQQEKIVNEIQSMHTVVKCLHATRCFSDILQGVGSLHSILERSLLERLGKREGGDTGSSAALCNYCGSCCIVTIFDRLWHRWIWPQRLAKSRASHSQGELLRERGEMVGTQCDA